MNYNLNKIILNELNNTVIFDNKNYYNYKEVDFYFKKYDDTNKLVVSFHAADPGQSLKPIFRGFNWNYNILCISDKLLELYPELNLTWYLSPIKSNIMDTYIEIIGLFNSKYENIIFTGSSGGGFPSLLFSCYFYKKALIFNSQIYLENYYSLLDKIINTLNVNKNELTITNIEEIITKYGKPYVAFIYCNSNDKHHYEKHYLPFNKFINDNNLNINFKLIEFKGAEPVHPQTDHHILLPTEKTIDKSIEELFN